MDVDKPNNLIADVTARKKIKRKDTRETREAQEKPGQPPASDRHACLTRLEEALGDLFQKQKPKEEEQTAEKEEKRGGFIEDFLSSRSRLISDSKGKIKHLVFQFVDWGRVGDELLNAYSTIIDSMESDVKFTFLTRNEEENNKIKELLKDKKNPERFNVITTDRDITMWTRDSMIPTKASEKETGKKNQTVILMPNRSIGETYLEEERSAVRALEEKFPDFKSQKLDDIYIDGGDIMYGPAGIFVGQGSIDKTIQGLKRKSESDPDFKFYIINYYEQKTGKKVTEEKTEGKKPAGEVSFEEAIRETLPDLLEQKFNSKLYIIGRDDPSTDRVESQPVFHIDMCVTQLDKKTVLLADPKIAADTLKKLKEENPDEYEKQIEEFCSSAGISRHTCEMWLERSSARYTYSEEDTNFDAARKHLESEGFKVISIPYISGSSHRIPYMTYNNCLMNDYTAEDGRHVKQVFLPTYGLKAVDDQAIKIYKDLGYEVIPLDFNDTAKLQGALRCISQVLDKSP